VEAADWSSWRGRRRAAPVVLVPRVDVRACCEAREGVWRAGDAPAARNCGGGVEEARRGGAMGNGGGAPGFGVEGSSRKPERSRPAAKDDRRGAWKEEVRKKRRIQGTELYTPKALGTG